MARFPFLFAVVRQRRGCGGNAIAVQEELSRFQSVLTLLFRPAPSESSVALRAASPMGAYWSYGDSLRRINTFALP